VKLVLLIKKTPIIASESKNTVCKGLMKNIGQQQELGVNVTNLVIAYVSFGLGFYAGAALYNSESYRNASVKSIIIGTIFGVLLWPLAMYVAWSFKKEEK
jgi:hypothetical protein